MVTRRRVLATGLTTVAAAAGTTAALRPMLTATSGSAAVIADDKAAAVGRPDQEGRPHQHGVGAEGATPPLFDEVYRDRRIQGFPSDTEEGVDLYIDGRPLELMRRVDGSWISVANHFQPYLTPLATARGAVDVIGRADLSMDSGHHH
ncbi:tyrosinase family oxidase copper chaperone [Streptomyces sp. NBC_01190]|uniref:tyrosinase family oxidase copper chaperone n=1 Tax=Streptomyces sp. NBC_01190 TaxID=2903767 RepID=UPI00386A1772|nr:tyrosinase cofactor [Streptomyces sp. NBC_01190]